MSSREFAEWGAFYGMEPFGDIRADIRSAMICKMIADAFRGKDSQPTQVSDFMPRFEVEEQSEEEMLRTVALLNMSFGGQDLRDEDEG